MKKLMVLVLSLAMVLSVIGVAAAEDTTLLTGNGSIAVADLEGYDTLTVTIQADDPDDTKNGWGVGGLCLDGSWSVTEGFNFTSNGEAEQKFVYAVADVVAATTGDTINVNCYNNFSVASVVVSTKAEEEEPVEEKVLASVENPANGTITILNGYTFTEEDIVVRFYIEAADDDHSGWGLGALCNSDWSVNVIELAAGTTAELKVIEMTLKEIGDAFAEAGVSATDGVILNDWADYASVAKIEVVSLAAEEPDPTPVPEDPTPVPEDPTPVPEEPTTTPEEPTATPTPGTEDTPQTGDTMSLFVLAALAVVTLGGVIVSKKARA